MRGICECMYFQNDHGDSVCKSCYGDIYACECPIVHRYNCPSVKNLRHHTKEKRA